ncbi:hypothetical protein Taro_022710, partial [Colocasia esculenta]|nr:hypothetical protein [Colocasia esculenta]
CPDASRITNAVAPGLPRQPPSHLHCSARTKPLPGSIHLCIYTSAAHGIHFPPLHLDQFHTITAHEHRTSCWAKCMAHLPRTGFLSQTHALSSRLLTSPHTSITQTWMHSPAHATSHTHRHLHPNSTHTQTFDASLLVPVAPQLLTWLASFQRTHAAQAQHSLFQAHPAGHHQPRQNPMAQPPLICISRPHTATICHGYSIAWSRSQPAPARHRSNSRNPHPNRPNRQSSFQLLQASSRSFR